MHNNSEQNLTAIANKKQIVNLLFLFATWCREAQDSNLESLLEDFAYNIAESLKMEAPIHKEHNPDAH